MNNKRVVCDGCGFYKDEFFISKHKSSKNYCNGCSLIVDREPNNVRTIAQEEFNKMLLVALKIPPLKLKDLKARLKKERNKILKTKARKILSNYYFGVKLYIIPKRKLIYSLCSFLLEYVSYYSWSWK